MRYFNYCIFTEVLIINSTVYHIYVIIYLNDFYLNIAYHFATKIGINDISPFITICFFISIHAFEAKIRLFQLRHNAVKEKIYNAHLRKYQETFQPYIFQVCHFEFAFSEDVSHNFYLSSSLQ